MFLKEKILETFDGGHRKRFFDMWLENFQQSDHDGDLSVEQLEFYLNVYFAVYARKHQVDVSGNYHRSLFPNFALPLFGG